MSAIEREHPALAAGRLLDAIGPDRFTRLYDALTGKAAPFLYLGQPRFSSWHGEKPITIEWDLTKPVPEHFRKMLKVP